MAKSHASINQWIREQEARLGIKSPKSGELEPTLPTVTVYPGPVAMERVAHFGADCLIANNPAYDSMCERLDAKLAEIIEGVNESFTPLRRAKSTRAARMPHVMTND